MGLKRRWQHKFGYGTERRPGDVWDEELERWLPPRPVDPREDRRLMEELRADVETQYLLRHHEAISRLRASEADLREVINGLQAKITKLERSERVPSCDRCDRQHMQLSKAYAQCSKAYALLDRFVECDWYDTGLQVPDELMADAHDFITKNSPKGYS